MTIKYPGSHCRPQPRCGGAPLQDKAPQHRVVVPLQLGFLAHAVLGAAIECWTDGSVNPEDALAYSAKILNKQLQIFINFAEEEEPEAQEPSVDRGAAAAAAAGRRGIRAVRGPISR